MINSQYVVMLFVNKVCFVFLVGLFKDASVNLKNKKQTKKQDIRQLDCPQPDRKTTVVDGW